MNLTDLVHHWFAEKMASGAISRNVDAFDQAGAATSDLIEGLEVDGVDPAEVVNAWFGAKIATGAIAHDTVAYSQAFAARADLIGRLAAVAASASLKAPVDDTRAKPPKTPDQPETAAAAASKE